jgi:hypothetical protein
MKALGQQTFIIRTDSMKSFKSMSKKKVKQTFIIRTKSFKSMSKKKVKQEILFS